jgi:hypothetical protein
MQTNREKQMYNSLDNQKQNGLSWSLNYQERMQQLRDLLTSKLDDESAMLGLSLEPIEQSKKD